ncbi:MAG: hypothetical protein JWN06_1573 [Propionibacteriaceae bacterium]|jgi:hypothetical protein|nr:hypothetical protein [Propionibacteriaceae bacterium]
MNFWDFFWLLLCSYLFIAYLMVMFQIIADIYRDPHLSGWSKALWTIALIIAPFLSALIYLIARGHGMNQRQTEAAQQAEADTDHYIQTVANQPNPTQQVASAKALLDNGAITQTEYDGLKAKALA